MKPLLPLLLFPLITLAQTAPDSTKKTIDLREDVIVTATRNQQAGPHNLMQRAEIQKFTQVQDLPYILDQQQSLVNTSDAGTGVGYTGLRIRGTDGSRINITINGVPVNDAESQNVFWVNLPDFASSAENIQIQRGVGSSTNGPGAFGGSVNMKTSNISPKAFGEATLMAGSFNTWRTSARFSSGLIKNRFFIEGRGSWITHDGYIDRASSRLWSYYIQTGLVLKKDIIRFVHFAGKEITYQAWYGVPQDSLQTNRTLNIAGTDFFSKNPAYPNQVDNYKQDYFQLIWNRHIRTGLDLNLTGFTTLGRGYYEEYKTAQFLPRYLVQPQITGTDTQFFADLVRQRWLSNGLYGLTGHVVYAQSALRLTGGFLASHYIGDHFGRVIQTTSGTADPNRRYYESTGNKTEASAFIKSSYTFFQKLQLFADLQYRFVNYTTAGDDNSGQIFDIARRFHFFNPKAGLQMDFPGQWKDCSHTAYITYGMAQREPSRDDLVDAPRGASPQHEILHDVEAGWTTRNPWFDVSLNGYFMYYVNQLVLTGKLNDVGNPIRTNVPESYRAGIEFATTIRPHRIIQIQLQGTWSRNKISRFTETITTYDENYSPVADAERKTTYQNTDISFSPQWIAGFTATLTPFKDFDLTLTGKYVGKQYLDNTQSEERQLNPYFYSNVRASYTFRIKEKNEIELFVFIQNLFNQLYETNGYTFREQYRFTDDNGNIQTTDPVHYNYFYPQAGIQGYGGLRVKF